MSRSIRLAAVAAIAVAALAPAAAHAATTPASSDLYVATADGGSLTPTGMAGDYTLTLRGTAANVNAFSDRPVRTTNTETLKRFVASWERNGFKADPPNAALVIDGAPAAHDVAVLEISHPRLNAKGRLTLDARAVKGEPTGSLAQLAKRADQRVARSFGKSSLFVDNAEPVVPVHVTVSGLNARTNTQVQFMNGTLAQDAQVQLWQGNGNAQLALAPNSLIISSLADGFGGEYTGAISENVSALNIDAQIPAGGSVTVQAGSGATTTIQNGANTVPLS